MLVGLAISSYMFLVCKWGEYFAPFLFFWIGLWFPWHNEQPHGLGLYQCYALSFLFIQLNSQRQEASLSFCKLHALNPDLHVYLTEQLSYTTSEPNKPTCYAKSKRLVIPTAAASFKTPLCMWSWNILVKWQDSNIPTVIFSHILLNDHDPGLWENINQLQMHSARTLSGLLCSSWYFNLAQSRAQHHNH